MFPPELLMARKPTPDTADAARKPARKTMPIQVASDIAHMAAVIAAHDAVSVGQLVNDFLRPFVEQHYRRVQQEIADRVRRMDAGG